MPLQDTVQEEIMPINKGSQLFNLCKPVEKHYGAVQNSKGCFLTFNLPHMRVTEGCMMTGELDTGTVFSQDNMVLL